MNKLTYVISITDDKTVVERLIINDQIREVEWEKTPYGCRSNGDDFCEMFCNLSDEELDFVYENFDESFLPTALFDFMEM